MSGLAYWILKRDELKGFTDFWLNTLIFLLFSEWISSNYRLICQHVSSMLFAIWKYIGMFLVVSLISQT